MGARQVIGALLFALAAACPAYGQDDKRGIGTELRKLPILISADQIDFNRQTNVVTARGNVEISQGDRILLADRVVYNRNTKIVRAIGNVSVTERTGETIFADRVELTDDLREGVVTRLRILFPDRTKVAANGGRRTKGRRTVMAKAVFSPCYLCKDDPTRAPLWQIKARKIVHDQLAKDIEYYDAQFEIFGVPILYTPYFQHPDPTVRRRSGFLVPTIGSDSQLGFTTKVPYFLVLGPDKDMTIAPLVTTQERAGLFTEYRQRIRNGAFKADSSITYVKKRNTDGNRISGNEVRGHVFSEGRFDIDDHWRWGFDGDWTTDDTYLRRYDVTSTNVLTSTAFLEGFHGRKYTSLRGYHFQDLREEADSRTIPIVLPFAQHHAIGQPIKGWGRWSFQSNIVNLYRTGGPDSRRLTVEGGWRLPYVHPAGHVVTVSADVHGDIYWVNDLSRTGQSDFNGVVGRVYPQAVLDWRFPLVREFGNVRQILEPRAALVASTKGDNSTKIPNDDSIDFEFDDSKLFSAHRFPGFDRVDGGIRIDYGISTAFYGNRGGKTEIFVGQSYTLLDDFAFAAGTGLADRLSDIVGRVRIAPSRFLDVLYRFRLNKDKFTPRRSEVTLSGGPKFLRVSANYLFFAETGASGEFEDREELRGSAVAQLTENWGLLGSIVYDLGPGGGLRTFGVGARFQNECCRVNAIFTRSLFRDRDFSPSNRFLLQVTLKHLGEIRSGQ